MSYIFKYNLFSLIEIYYISNSSLSITLMCIRKPFSFINNIANVTFKFKVFISTKNRHQISTHPQTAILNPSPQCIEIISCHTSQFVIVI